MCCSQSVRWRGQISRMLQMEGKRYNLWMSEKEDEVCGVGAMVKEELCEKVVKARKVSDSDANPVGY